MMHYVSRRRVTSRLAPFVLLAQRSQEWSRLLGWSLAQRKETVS